MVGPFCEGGTPGARGFPAASDGTLAPMPASADVRTLFASVARSYDRANQVLSLGLHHGWRRAAVRESGVKPGNRVLDCATGTGDLAIEFQRAVGPEGEVVGTDFCEEMLALAPREGR